MDDDSGKPAPQRKRVRRTRCTVEELPTGSWRIRVRGRRPDGRRFDRSQTFSQGTRDERRAAAMSCRAAWHRWAEEVEAGLIGDELSLTLAQLHERVQRSRLGPTKGTHRAAVKHFVHLQGVDVRELTDAKMAWFVGRLQQKRLSAAYIRTIYAIIRKIVGIAVAQRWIAEVPWRDPGRWLPTERETKTRDALRSGELASLLDAARSLDAEARARGEWSDLELRVRAAHALAMRPVELARLGPDAIQKSKAGPWVVVFESAKKGGRLQKPVPESLRLELARHWELMPEGARRLGLFFPRRRASGQWSKREEVKAGTRTAQLFEPGEIEKLRARSGLATFVAYQLRHTGITDAATSLGLSAVEIQAFSGHKSLRMVSRYAHSHVTDELTRRLAERELPAKAAPVLSVVATTPTSTGSSSSRDSESGEGDSVPTGFKCVRKSGEKVGRGAAAPTGAPTGSSSSRMSESEQGDSLSTGKHDVEKPRGRAVGADRVRELTVHAAALVPQLRHDGGAARWAALRDWSEVDMGELDEELGDMLGARVVDGDAARMVAELRAIVRGMALEKEGKKGSKKRLEAKETKVLRLVSGNSFTVSKEEE